MSQKYNNEDSEDEEESLFLDSSIGLEWKDNIKEKISKIYTWNVRLESTGFIDEPKEINFIKYPFDRYKITVAVSSNNEFLGITEVQLNKDFRSYKLKPSSRFSSEVEDYYFEK